MIPAHINYEHYIDVMPIFRIKQLFVYVRWSLVWWYTTTLNILCSRTTGLNRRNVSVLVPFQSKGNVLMNIHDSPCLENELKPHWPPNHPIWGGRYACIASFMFHLNSQVLPRWSVDPSPLFFLCQEGSLLQICKSFSRRWLNSSFIKRTTEIV
jgi:hypothetical protein